MLVDVAVFVGVLTRGTDVLVLVGVLVDVTVVVAGAGVLVRVGVLMAGTGVRQLNRLKLKTKISRTTMAFLMFMLAGALRQERCAYGITLAQFRQQRIFSPDREMV